MEALSSDLGGDTTDARAGSYAASYAVYSTACSIIGLPFAGFDLVGQVLDLRSDLPGSAGDWAAFGSLLGSEEADLARLRVAGWWAFPKTWGVFPRQGRAWEYLEHYISGAGTDKVFALADLLRDVPGIRTRLARGLGEWTRGDITTSMQPHIPIRQSDYQRPGPFGETGDRDLATDWLMALGSYTVYIRPRGPVQRTPVGIRRAFDCWGSNLYQWHPNEQRVSQCIHQSADRLRFNAILRRAKPFRMIASPCGFEVWASSLASTEWNGRVLPRSL